MGGVGNRICRRAPMGGRPTQTLRRTVARACLDAQELSPLHARVGVDWVLPCSFRVSRVGRQVCVVVGLVCVVGLVVWLAVVRVVSGTIVAVVVVVWCLGLAVFRVLL